MRWVMAMAAIAAAAPAAAAENEGHAADRALAPFVACRATRDPAVRLACFDAALDRLQAQVAQRQVVIIDHEQVAQDRRTLFGFSPSHEVAATRPPRPAPTPRAARPASEEVAEIDSTVVSAQPYGYDQWTIRLATGATWRTTEAGIPIQPKPGSKVHVHRALMNSFLLRVGAFRAVRAVRVN